VFYYGFVAAAGWFTLYYLYTRVYQYYETQAFYRKQKGIVEVKGSWPIVGNCLQMLDVLNYCEKNDIKATPFVELYKRYCGEYAPVMMLFFCHKVTLWISDWKIVEDIYYKHNKVFSKAQQTVDTVYPFMGRTIIFAESTNNWRERRKAIAPAFYKGKLEHMIDTVRGCLVESIERIESLPKTEGKGTRINLMSELSRIQVKILLKCAIGEDLSDHVADFVMENGTVEKKDIPYILRQTFGQFMDRYFEPHLALFPELNRYLISNKERTAGKNAQMLRNLFRDIIGRRRELINSN